MGSIGTLTIIARMQAKNRIVIPTTAIEALELNQGDLAKITMYVEKIKGRIKK